MAIRCCYGCVPPKRHTACWDTCPDYKAEKEKDAEKKATMRKLKAIDDGIYQQRSRAVNRARKGTKKK